MPSTHDNRFFFQDPNTGWPMVLVKRDRLPCPVVIAAEGDNGEDPSDEIQQNALEMSGAVRSAKATNLPDAVRVLRRQCGVTE